MTINVPAGSKSETDCKMYDFQITLEINMHNLLMKKNKESLKEFGEGFISDLEGAPLQTNHFPNLLELAMFIFFH